MNAIYLYFVRNIFTVGRYWDFNGIVDNRSTSNLNQSLTIPALVNVYKKAFVNIVGKGENSGNKSFVLLLQCFIV